MMKKVVFLLIFLGFSSLLSKNIAFLASQADTYIITQAMRELDLPEKYRVHLITPEELKNNKTAMEFLNDSDVVLVDVMISELVRYLENFDKKSRKVFALRASRNDAYLIKQGYVFSDELKPYFDNITKKNIKNLIQRAVNISIDSSIKFEEVEKIPLTGIYHPDSDRLFTSFEEYNSWYSEKENFNKDGKWIGMTFYSSNINEGQSKPIDHMITELEKAGYNVLGGFGWDPDVVSKIFLDEKGSGRVDFIVAYSMKFSSALNSEMNDMLEKIDAPVFNAISSYYNTITDWKFDPQGLSTMEVAWAVANPELSGLIEPTVVAGKEEFLDVNSARKIFLAQPVKENTAHLITRIKMWENLKNKPNPDKKIAIFIYNNTPGKQNVGASYLNVFKSLRNIVSNLGKAGYNIDEDKNFTEDDILELILKHARNIGSWAPGELEKMKKGGISATISIDKYKNWYKELPLDYRTKLEEQWGQPEDTDIMAIDGEIIIPKIEIGNIIILPEPSRGYADDAVKLYHSPTMYPHHQYTAVYLWVKKEFNADAVIHLGTHGTQEWLPGKQAGLTLNCPPEVLGTDIPNFYPYIVDDVGEGIQAKRRSRAVTIDHLTPPLNKAGINNEYRKLYGLINSYYSSKTLGGQTGEIKLQEIQELTFKLGIHTDLQLEKVDDTNIRKVEDYLVEVGMSLAPYGLHSYGISPSGKALDDTVEAIKTFNKSTDRSKIRKNLEVSGFSEMKSLINGLDGRYTPPGVGNDPVRNPEAIPTGKNFFGFDPQKIPSKAAWELGKKAAVDIVEKHLKANGKYPEKIAIILWATETIRNEGVNESTAMYLMGIQPVWDKVDKITDVKPIPSKDLNRPRIDVLLNPSGLYRDIFPNMLNLLDNAVQKASVQTDLENFIAKNNLEIKQNLMKEGISDKEADMISKMRIFSEKPGNYGNRVSEIASSSGLWDDNADMAKAYKKHTGYAFGQGKWGINAEDALSQNLKKVDTAVHSISSSVYGTMDNDDMFQFVGGLSLAVEKESGKAPETLITMQRTKDEIKSENIEKTIGREMKTRYFNPKWIEGMKKENYAGAREISNFVDYMWGWQATIPHAIGEESWQQTFEVYVEDKYNQELKKFFNKNNPWAYQSVTARMVEAIRKEFWDADEETEKKIVEEYVENVLEHGLSCSDNTCANPLMHEHVINVAVKFMSPEKIAKMKNMLKDVTKKDLQQQLKELKELKNELQKGFTGKQIQRDMNDSIQGFKMESMDQEKKQSSKGENRATLPAILFSIFIMIFLGIGFFLRSEKK
jgi:cobaltochelatase CobN